MVEPVAIESLWHAHQLLWAGRRRRVVYVRGAESLAHVAALGHLLQYAHEDLLPKRRRWEVLGYRRILNLGAISGILANQRRRDLPRLHAQPFHQARIQRVRALSFRAGGGAPGHRSRVLADRLRLLAADADAQLLALGPLRQRIHDDCEAVREELERAVDMFEHAP